MESRNSIPFLEVTVLEVKMNKLLFDRKKKNILDQIESWNPLIDRIVLSGFHSYAHLRRQLGNPKINNEYLKVSDHNGKVKNRSSYNTFGNVWYCGKLISVLVNPPASYYPFCMLEVNEPSQEWLIGLNSKLPNLKLSSLEYAVDIFPRDPKFVEDLTNFLSKYLHCRHKRSSKIEENLSTHATNSVIHYTTEKGTGKLYSRGPDTKKIGDGWAIENCDRSRIEFKATIDYYLPKYGIKTLEAFIRNAKMTQILARKFKFQTFKKSVSLGIPSEHELYDECDENGMPVTFQAKLIYLARNVSNIYPYIIKPKGFDKFIESWHESIADFDLKWLERTYMTA
ncbi:MAG: hypothetical protein ACLP3B_06270 [Syntrophobacteraceae bacterium]